MALLNDLPGDDSDRGLTNAIIQCRLHNDASPIFRVLPTEILRLIASGLADRDVDELWQKGAFDVAPGLALSHTCLRWREVALAIPEFWTVIPLLHDEWARECLSRSQPLPIILITTADSDMLAKEASAEHLNRALFMVLQNEDVQDEGSPWLTHPTPLLERLRMDFAHRSEKQSSSSRSFFGGQEPPRLREVSIGNALLVQPHGLLVPFLWARSLKSLSFHSCRVWRDVIDMVATLSRVPELEELRIERSYVLAEVPATWHRPGDVSPTVHLPHLKNVWINIDVVPTVVVLRHIVLPQTLQTLSVRVNNSLNDYAALNALIRLPLLPIIQETIQQPLMSRKLAYFMSNQTYRLVASRPMQSDGVMSEYAGRQYVRDTKLGAVSGPFLSLEVDHRPLMIGGASTSVVVATAVPSLFAAGSLSLDGPVDDIPLVADKGAWPSRLHWLRALECLELCRGGALGFAFQADAMWLQRNKPAILCLRDVPLDMPITITEPKPAHNATFFDLLMRRIAPWIEAQSLKRVVVRQSPLQQWMLDDLERLIGHGCVDWDHTVSGAGTTFGESG